MSPRTPSVDFTAGVRACIAWLHEEAKQMNDPHARSVLNNAAFHIGQNKPTFVSADHPTPPRPASPDREALREVIIQHMERCGHCIAREPVPDEEDGGAGSFCGYLSFETLDGLVDAIPLLPLPPVPSEEQVEAALAAYQKVMFAHALNVNVTGEAMTGKEARLQEAIFKGRQKEAMRAALSILPGLPQPTGEDAEEYRRILEEGVKERGLVHPPLPTPGEDAELVAEMLRYADSAKTQATTVSDWRDLAYRVATALSARAVELEAARARLNTPELHKFAEGVVVEAAHQRERWGEEHDAGKEPQDWFWLIGYLAGKALHAAKTGDRDKALHHTISTAATLANWHAALNGDNHEMRPGHGEEFTR